VLARELSAGPRALVAAQPTQGLDVGATEDMYARLRAAARSGVGVLLLSTELEEILALATRIFVIARGRIVAELRSGEATAERLGTLAAAPAA
jgi:simple sugar transport system ATP-binding protein